MIFVLNHFRSSAIADDIVGGEVSDILIRDVPGDVLSAIDSRAARLGISRSEYVRRRLAQDAAVAGATSASLTCVHSTETSPIWPTPT